MHRKYFVNSVCSGFFVIDKVILDQLEHFMIDNVLALTAWVFV